MRYFFIEKSEREDSILSITGPDARHIKTVLRMNPGDKIGLFDGKGFEYEAKIVSLSPKRVMVSLIRRFLSTAESSLQIIVAQAFLKEKKMDDLVRKLTELGIAGWIPFFSQRSIARPDKKRLAGRSQRWERISTEALKQCRRKNMLEISEAVTFDEVLGLSKNSDLKIVFWENETTLINRGFGPESDNLLNSIMVMLGPEGGFTGQEIERARQAGFVTAGLGPRILRAETATLAAGTLIQYLFGDMGS